MPNNPPLKHTTKEQAKASGERYFYGRVCSKGHAEGKRSVADGKCWHCVKETRERRKHKTAAYVKSYYEKNPGLREARFAAWRAKNVDYDRTRCLTWQKANMPKAIAGIAKRKASILKRTPAWCNEAEIVQFYEEAKRLTDSTGIQHEVDHIVPLQGKTVSGLHVPGNLRVITCAENRRKGNRFGEHNASLQMGATDLPEAHLELSFGRGEESGSALASS